MTRKQIRNKIEAIIEDIEPQALDDSDLYIPRAEINRAVDAIMKLWDQGFTYEVRVR